MKQLFKHAIILCLILFTVACEDIVDPGELGLEDQLLVVNSIISPHQEVLRVQVSQSNSLFGVVPDDNTEKGLVKDAVVTLSNGTSSIDLSYRTLCKTLAFFIDLIIYHFRNIFTVKKYSLSLNLHQFNGFLHS